MKPPPSRLEQLDALRGFALFGILTVNITAFASPFFSSMLIDPRYVSPLDHTVRLLVACLFEAKFYLLFSFLFGYSFTLQMAAAERADAAFEPRFSRRLLGLMILGLLHAFLLFSGDILIGYALMGALLLKLRHWDDEKAIKVAFRLIKWQVFIWGTLGVLAALGEKEPAFASSETIAAAVAEIMKTEIGYHGTPADVVAQNWRVLHQEAWIGVGLVQLPNTVAMFLLGLVAGRRRWLEDPAAALAMLRPRLPLLATLGFGGSLLYAFPSSLQHGYSGAVFLGMTILLLSAPFLTACYVALMLTLFQSRFGPALIRALAPAGSMSLSNYLTQSLVCALLFTGYGLKLMGQLAPLQVFLTGCALFVLQLLLSAWWMRRYRYGPFEWLLRALTLAQWPTWRRTEARTLE